ncbi:NmrA-like family protein [Fusarium flagelliforme]|uniref:Nmra-like family protein n=1 Tax=Fusarium flagelliforme TaxID=2675880 RepID=A0A395MA78_9HYPO|nr:NmrA-like family protein [Fusarium flagelliforme]KAH7173943.1 NmrA-like family protein [Fusarium flagelliforme]RFN44784.1 nmra-like family protein [Fusarium flagelliforme]
MSAYKNIAIVGASGSTGKIILNALTATNFTTTVLARKESKATYPANVKVRLTDFSEDDLTEALKGQDVLISTLGVEGFDQQQKLVDAAVRAGVKRFLPSEFSSSSEDPVVMGLLPLFEVKKNLIEYLKSKEKDGLSWTGLATGLLFDWGIANGFLGYDIKNRTAKVWDDGDKKFTLTNEKQLAQAVVSTLGHPDETRNRYLYVYSVVTTQNEILQSLENATGGKWTVEKTTTDAEVAEARKRLSAGDFSGGFILVHALTYGNTEGLRANYAEEKNSGNDILGIEIEGVDETVRRVVGN